MSSLRFRPPAPIGAEIENEPHGRENQKEQEIIVKTFTVAAATLLALSLSGIAQASPEMVTNGSFEAPGFALPAGSYCYLNLPGLECGSVPSWSGAFPLMLSNSGPWGNPGTPFGDVLIGLQNTSNADQSLALSAGTYSLSWSDAGRGNYGTGAEQYQVSFDGVTLASSTVAMGAAWQTHTLTFAASGAGVLSFQGLSSGGDSTAFIDNVSVSAVPEPEVFGMMLLGLCLIGYRANRGEKFSK